MLLTTFIMYNMLTIIYYYLHIPWLICSEQISNKKYTLSLDKYKIQHSSCHTNVHFKYNSIGYKLL